VPSSYAGKAPRTWSSSPAAPAPAAPSWPPLGLDVPAAREPGGPREPSSFVPVADPASYRRMKHGQRGEDPQERARQEGFREGFRRGKAEGTAEAMRALGGVRELLQRAAEELRRSRERLLRDLEAEVVRLALAVAARVVRREGEENRELVVATVREALRRVEGEDHLVIRVHASDLETARSHREVWQDAMDGVERIEIVSDRRVPPGGCIIDTAGAQVDARLETQLEELTRGLRDHLEEGHVLSALGSVPPPGEGS
jgi:flagellar assembly protein FliH